jgi:23S rRNA (uracil1939-C5)-methyltransferase
VLEPAIFALIAGLRQVARDLIPPGGSAEATLTRTDSGIDLLIEAAERPDLRICEILAQFAEEHDLAGVVWRLGADDFVVVERRPVRVLLSEVAVSFPPGAFLQASPSAEIILVEEVLSGVGPGRPALDLFAGLGTFTFALARGGPVHAVEGDVHTAAALARAAADQPRVTVERRDLARNPIPASALARYAVAVFDPPRAGAARQAVALAASAIETIIAISCNPATFARDAAQLVGGGYRLERVTPVDQFVWTPASRARCDIPAMILGARDKGWRRGRDPLPQPRIPVESEACSTYEPRHSTPP